MRRMQPTPNSSFALRGQAWKPFYYAYAALRSRVQVIDGSQSICVCVCVYVDVSVSERVMHLSREK